MERYAPGFHSPDESQCIRLADQLACIAEDRGIKLKSCAHDFLVSDKVLKARCIDPEVLMQVVDSSERRSAVEKLGSAPTRKHCGCAASKDIGHMTPVGTLRVLLRKRKPGAGEEESVPHQRRQALPGSEVSAARSEAANGF